jgi:hypothetical protein
MNTELDSDESYQLELLSPPPPPPPRLLRHLRGHSLNGYANLLWYHDVETQ